jgi:hypothetical protein
MTTEVANPKERQRVQSECDKNAVRGAVALAIRTGVLQVMPCEVCGRDGMCKGGWRQVLAHHPDYNFPLAVIWLCGKHHLEWHGNYIAVELREERSETTVSQHYRKGLQQMDRHGAMLITMAKQGVREKPKCLDESLKRARLRRIKAKIARTKQLDIEVQVANSYPQTL